MTFQKTNDVWGGNPLNIIHLKLTILIIMIYIIVLVIITVVSTYNNTISIYNSKYINAFCINNIIIKVVHCSNGNGTKKNWFKSYFTTLLIPIEKVNRLICKKSLR